MIRRLPILLLGLCLAGLTAAVWSCAARRAKVPLSRFPVFPSSHTFSVEACAPAILDMQTGKLNATNAAVLAYWRALPPAMQRTFHRVACENSRDPDDLFWAALISKTAVQLLESGKARKRESEK